MSDRTYVCFLWREGFRNYKPEHVNILAHALQYFDREPHRFVCITDETEGFSPAVEVMPLPEAARRLCDIRAPQGGSFPSSYRRLWCFSPEAVVLGERIMLTDVDCMVVANRESYESGEYKNRLATLWAVDADFVGWKPEKCWGNEDRIGGGTWMHRTGTVTWLWDKFMENPAKMVDETRKLGWNGSDQAIMSRFLRRKYPVWPRFNGIYGAQEGVFEWDLPPKDARIVHFNGDDKPWGQSKLWMRAYCNHFRRSPYDNVSGQTESQEPGRVQRHRARASGRFQQVRGSASTVDAVD